MNNLCKALMIAVGSAITYVVVTKVAEKIGEQPAQDDIEDVTEEVMEELEDDFDEEVVENMFCRIRKEIKEYMKQAANASKERLELCLNFVSDPKNRLALGVVVLCTGVGIGGGLIASAYVKMPE